METINNNRVKLLTNYIMLNNNYDVDDNINITNIFPEYRNGKMTLRIEYTIWGEFKLKEYINNDEYQKISREYEIDQILK